MKSEANDQGIIAVIGAGAFGSAIAIALAETGIEVRLWGRNPEKIAHLKITRNSMSLPAGVSLPDLVTPISDIQDLADASLILVALPVQIMRGALKPLREVMEGKWLLSLSKGIERETGALPHEILGEFSSHIGVIGGPGFASDLANGLPAAHTIATNSEEDTSKLQHQLSTQRFRLYHSDDLVGVALGGALKNIYAIAAGIAFGAGLGETARAAVISRSFSEMQRIAIARGAKAETITGLCGLGDLVLSATSGRSRNYAAGLCIGEGRALPEGQTMEGLATAKAISKIGTQLKLELPLAENVVAILDGKLSVQEAMRQMLSRPLIAENSPHPTGEE